MRLPRDRKERDKLYRNLIRYCEASRPERRMRFRERKMYYLTGSGDGVSPRYNKIQEHVLYSASYLYAQASVRFGVTLPARYGEDWTEEEDVSRLEMQRLWRLSGAGRTFGSAVAWAHVMDTAILKVTMDMNRPTLTMLDDPSDIGVGDEKSNQWRQEMLTHWYTLSMDAFARTIAWMPPSRQRELLERAEDNAVPGYGTSDDMLPSTVRGIILSSASPTMIGSVNTVEAPRAVPIVKIPMVRMAELWVWDDARADYTVVTCVLPTEDMIDEKPNPLLVGQHPFFPVNLTVGGTPGYLWGDAPINALLKLQLWRSEKMEELDKRDKLELRPPIFFENMSNTLDGEKADRFREPGGNLSSSIPGAKATPIVPAPLPDRFGFVDKIDDEFSRAGGLPKLLGGAEQAGVRSGDQALTQAMLGAGPTMERAMLVEEVLQAVATCMFRLHRRTSTMPLRKGDGSSFLLSQMPSDALVEVWGHSQSPLYAEKIVQKAIVAKEYGAIDGADLLEFLQLPMPENLKLKARKMAEAAAARGTELVDIKKKESEAKILRARGAVIKDVGTAASKGELG